MTRRDAPHLDALRLAAPLQPAQARQAAGQQTEVKSRAAAIHKKDVSPQRPFPFAWLVPFFPPLSSSLPPRRCHFHCQPWLLLSTMAAAVNSPPTHKSKATSPRRRIPDHTNVVVVTTSLLGFFFFFFSLPANILCDSHHFFPHTRSRFCSRIPRAYFYSSSEGVLCTIGSRKVASHSITRE